MVYSLLSPTTFPEVSDSKQDKPDYINRPASAKREIDAILEPAGNFLADRIDQFYSNMVQSTPSFSFKIMHLKNKL